MGQVASAEYAMARANNELAPQQLRSPAAKRAMEAAGQESAAAGVNLARGAARGAEQEASRRGRQLWQATDTAAARDAEEASVAWMAEAAGRWRGRRQLKTHVESSKTARIAAAAAELLRRERPAASAEATAKRTKAGNGTGAGGGGRISSDEHGGGIASDAYGNEGA